MDDLSDPLSSRKDDENPSWEVFGKIKEASIDQPDPQRDINTDFIFRAGISTFAVLSRSGFIDSSILGESGLYFEDMRVVSKLSFLINEAEPVVQSASRDSLDTCFTFSMSDPHPNVGMSIEYTLSEKVVCARLRLTNFSDSPFSPTLSVYFAADHFDTFYVRFPPKGPRGVLHKASIDTNGKSIDYDTLDGRRLTSWIQFSQPPAFQADDTMCFTPTIDKTRTWELLIYAGATRKDLCLLSWEELRSLLEHERAIVFKKSAELFSAMPRLQKWLDSSKNILSALTASLDTGLYPYAGLPWFALPFGRDGIIVGLQTLEINPLIMRGVLGHHAKFQATLHDPFHQASPGKTMHEMRLGETSRARLNPFHGYYGGIDTTPLFVIAVYAFWKRSGDDEFMKNMWPHVALALQWLKTEGDIDGDSFIEYNADPGMGLANQGWKDSWDAIVNSNGTFPSPPIALSEVQAYAYSAWRGAEAMARALGFTARSLEFAENANRLFDHFNASFWQADMETYALALDGKKSPCRVLASNSAHLAWCGIVPEDRTGMVLQQILTQPLFSGWGIRTLAEGEVRYRADLYHRGPCWPHEMSIAMWSAEAADERGAIAKLAEAALDTAEAFDFKLPELFCGYARTTSERPIHYKSANPFHAWAAAVAFATVQSALGLKVDGQQSEVFINPSGLPLSWAPIEVLNLSVGNGEVSFRVELTPQTKLAVRILKQVNATIRLAGCDEIKA